MPSAQPGMQIGQQRGHLLLGEAAGETRHHSLPCQHILPHRFIRGRNSAGQCLAVKEAVQVRRDFLQRQIVVLMAMGATNLVEMLAFCFCGVSAGAEWQPASTKPSQPAKLPMHKPTRLPCRQSWPARLRLLSKLPTHIIPVDHLKNAFT